MLRAHTHQCVFDRSQGDKENDAERRVMGEGNLHGVGKLVMVGITRTRSKRSALCIKFSIAHRTARRLPLPSALFTATATVAIAGAPPLLTKCSRKMSVDLF